MTRKLLRVTAGELKGIFGGVPLRAAMRRTIVSLEQLAAVCARIHAEGIAMDDRESLDQIRCVGAPIGDTARSILASVAISAPARSGDTARTRCVKYCHPPAAHVDSGAPRPRRHCSRR